MGEANELPTVRRLVLFATIGSLILAVLVLQLARMQLIGAEPLRAQIKDRVLRIDRIEAPRGLIYDRNGHPLVRNVPELSLVLIPGEITTDFSIETDILRQLERETGTPYARLEALLHQGRDAPDVFAPLTLLSQLEDSDAIRLRAVFAAIPGVAVQTHPVRIYEGGELYGRILGHVGPLPKNGVNSYLDAGYPLDARVGLSGIELTHQEMLRGTDGRRLVATTPAGRVLEVIAEHPPNAGEDLFLTIDAQIQRATTEALARAISERLPAPHPDDDPDRVDPQAIGAAVVLDVRTGDLLALVSLPSVDAGVFSGSSVDPEGFSALLTDPRRPLIDRAFAEVHSPGSIFKPIVGLAALHEGIATPATRIVSTGAITVQDEFNPDITYVFRDWAAHGALDFAGGLIRSSDVYYYYLAGGYSKAGQQLFEGLGIERVARYARAFGLGSPTGLDLPGEAAGLVPDPEWKRKEYGEPWVLGDTYTMGIGQGFLSVTPLQMAVAAAALANGGEVLVPRVVNANRDESGLHSLPTVVSGQLPANTDEIAVITDALRRAADPGGTAARGEPTGLTIAGKTGTAEFGIPHADGSYDTHAWYLGWAPYENPQIAVVVYLEHGVGALDAAPVARDIFEAYWAPESRAQHTTMNVP